MPAKRRYGRRQAYRRRRAAKRKMSAMRYKPSRRLYKRKSKYRKRRLRCTSTFTPLRRLVKLYYNQSIANANIWGAGGGVVQTDYYFRCNCTYTPSASTAPALFPNHQPMFYDQLSQFYLNNCVLGSQITYKLRVFSPAGGADFTCPPLMIYMFRSEAGIMPPTPTFDAAKEFAAVNPNFKVYELMIGGANVGKSFKFKQTWSIHKQASVTDVKDNLDDYGCTFNTVIQTPPPAGTVPAKPWFYSFRVVPKYACSQENDLRYELNVSMTMITLAYNRKNNLDQS